MQYCIQVCNSFMYLCININSFKFHCVPPLLSVFESVEMDESREDLGDYREEEDREQAEEEDEEEESEPVGLLQFGPAILLVSCSSVSGDLYKNRNSLIL